MQRSLSPTRKNRPIRALLLLTQPTVLVFIVLLVLMQWRVPTRIQAEFFITHFEESKNTAESLALLEIGNLSRFRVQKGDINFPEFPEREKVTLLAQQQVELQAVDTFLVEELAVDKEQSSMFHIRVSGVAKQIRSSFDGKMQDQRVTKFDVLKHSTVAMLAGIVLWGVLTVIGWLKVYQALT